MKDEGKLHLKLDIRNNPQPADGKSLVWIRAQVYTTVGSETYVPPAQNVTFQIEDGGTGQSNAVFEDTGTKTTSAESNATSGWTPWRYFKSKQDGPGTLQAHLTEHTDVSATKGFSFAPAVGNLPSVGILEVFGQAYYWSSEFSYAPGIIGAYIPDRYNASGFSFEPAGKDAVKIKDARNRYVNTSPYDSFLTMRGPGTVFTVALVKGQDSVITLEANGRYVCAYSSTQDGWPGYNLFANGTNPEDPAAFFQVQVQPVPPYKLTITSCPASLKLGESANVSGTLTGLDGPVPSATCNVSYRNSISTDKDTLRGPSQTQCIDGKFSFTVTADVVPPMSDADVIVSYPTTDYTARDAKWITITAGTNEA